MKFIAILSAAVFAAVACAAPGVEKRGSGQATYYYQNSRAGNCGKVHQDSEALAALQTSSYAGGAHCGKYITVKNENNGKTVVALVADSCPSCASSESVDLSVAAFQAIGDLNSGVLPVTWWFNN